MHSMSGLEAKEKLFLSEKNMKSTSMNRQLRQYSYNVSD